MLTPHLILPPHAESLYRIVEFFSPYCPHCMHFKPTYQTIYEFYYTSKTIPSYSTRSPPRKKSIVG